MLSGRLYPPVGRSIRRNVRFAVVQYHEPIMNFLAIWLALSVITVIFLCRLFAVSGPPQQR
jgi:hypothetical protein